jgi:hypothetical protein
MSLHEHDTIEIPDWIPADLVPLYEQVWSELPAFPSRKKACAVWTNCVHQYSHRTAETSPLRTRLLNGQACFDRREFMEDRFRKLLESPVIRGGRQTAEQQAA